MGAAPGTGLGTTDLQCPLALSYVCKLPTGCVPCDGQISHPGLSPALYPLPFAIGSRLPSDLRLNEWLEDRRIPIFPVMILWSTEDEWWSQSTSFARRLSISIISSCLCNIFCCEPEAYDLSAFVFFHVCLGHVKTGMIRRAICRPSARPPSWWMTGGWFCRRCQERVKLLPLYPWEKFSNEGWIEAVRRMNLRGKQYSWCPEVPFYREKKIV